MKFLKTLLILTSSIVISSFQADAYSYKSGNQSEKKSKEDQYVDAFFKSVKQEVIKQIKEDIRDVLRSLNATLEKGLQIQKLKALKQQLNAKLNRLQSSLIKSTYEFEKLDLGEDLVGILEDVDTLVSYDLPQNKEKIAKQRLGKNLVQFDNKITDKMKEINAKLENTKLGSKINCSLAFTVKNLKSREFKEAQALYSRATTPDGGKCSTNSQQKDTTNFRKAMIGMIFDKKKSNWPTYAWLVRGNSKLNVETFGYIHTNDLNFSNKENRKKLLKEADNWDLHLVVDEEKNRVYFVDSEGFSKITKFDVKFLNADKEGFLIVTSKSQPVTNSQEINSGPDDNDN